MDERRLTLRTERLTELTTADLAVVAAGATTLGCEPSDIVRDLSYRAASLCCYTGWCAAGRD